MKGRWILATVFLLLAIGAGYMTVLMWQTGDSAKWLFLVFTLFFLTLVVALLVPEFKRKPEPEKQTRFVSHWFMMLAVLALAAIIVAAIVGAVLRR